MGFKKLIARGKGNGVTNSAGGVSQKARLGVLGYHFSTTLLLLRAALPSCQEKSPLKRADSGNRNSDRPVVGFAYHKASNQSSLNEVRRCSNVEARFSSNGSVSSLSSRQPEEATFIDKEDTTWPKTYAPDANVKSAMTPSKRRAFCTAVNPAPSAANASAAAQSNRSGSPRRGAPPRAGQDAAASDPPVRRCTPSNPGSCRTAHASWRSCAIEGGHFPGEPVRRRARRAERRLRRLRLQTGGRPPERRRLPGRGPRCAGPRAAG